LPSREAHDSLRPMQNSKIVGDSTKSLFAQNCTGASPLDEMDRRKSTRYSLKALVEFLWKDSQGNPHQGTGSMRDISVRGLFVATTAPPPVGTMVRLEACFESSQTEPGITVRAKGHICRVEKNGDRKRDGFAAFTRRLKVQSSGNQSLGSDCA
jgi:hypothetical protein